MYEVCMYLHVLVVLSVAGCGLMEIVTAPVMSSGADAASFVRELQLLLRTIKTCDGNMEGEK